MASLYEAALDLHYAQFPLAVPVCLRRFATPSSDARRAFVREWEVQICRLAQFNGCLPDARYVSIAIPSHGLCRLRLVHQLTPTVATLRQLISEVWPWMERADVLDCQEVIDDGCPFVVQHARCLHAAWFCVVPDGTDVLFVPFGQHPCSCIPCPLGHLSVARRRLPLALPEFPLPFPEGLLAAVLDADMEVDHPSLLQLKAARVDASCDMLHRSSSTVTWRIWTFQGPQVFHAAANATYREVDQALQNSGFEFKTDSLCPVSSGDFQLLAIPPGLDSHCWP